MKIRYDNLLSAIAIAIRSEEEANRRTNQPFESAFLAGLRETLRAMERGERIEVVN